MSFDDKASHRMAGARDRGSKGMAGRIDHPLISGINKDLKELVLSQRGDEGGRQGQAGLHFAHRSYANSM